MNQKRLMKTKWFRGIALGLAFLLALPSALANVGTISAAAAEEAVPTKYGDINGDNVVDAGDALEALRSAAKLIELSEAQTKFGNVDGESEVTASDALLILQFAAKLITKFPGEQTITPRPAATPTPEATARPTAPPQTFDEKNVKAGEKLKVLNENGASYDKDTDIYVFSGGMEQGIEVENPIGNNKDFAEDYGYLRTAKPADGKLNPWDLKGSVLGWNADGGKEEGVDHAASDKRIYNAPITDGEPPYEEGQEPVDYDLVPQKVPPEGGHKGLSISFWLQTQDEKESAPLLVFYDPSYTTLVTVNGSVRFGTTTLEMNKLENTRYEYFSAKEWHYYTVTYANDWITIYVDGYEVPFDVVSLRRSKDSSGGAAIGYFNDGFLTRYNTTLTWTEEDFATDWRCYLKDQHGNAPGYAYDSITSDEFTIFGNTRYRGTHSNQSTGAKLMLTHMISANTKVYVGGANTNALESQARHSMESGTLVTGMTYNLEELNAAEVYANYTVAARNKPGGTSVTAAPATEKPEATPLPSVDLLEGREFKVQDASIATVTKDDKDLDHYTFKAASGDPTIDAGVQFENIFSNKEEKAIISETLDSALDRWKTENNSDLFPAGVEAGKAGSCHTYYGNYGDTYYGDLTTLPAILERDHLNDPTDASVQQTKFHRPVWDKGASIGFWLKPSEALINSDSPILTMYGSGDFIFTMRADGSICYLDVNPASWDGGQVLSPNKGCYNTFVTEGNPEQIKADDWNYYTITFANDWIGVYVNGEELVYTVSGIRRPYMKDFNGGFLSKYNPIGLLIDGEDDPHEYVRNNGNGTAADSDNLYGNYGGLTKKVTTLAEKMAMPGTQKDPDNDDASIRANGVYENAPGYFLQEAKDGEDNYKYTLLLDNLTQEGAKFFIGGYPTEMSKAKGWLTCSTKTVQYSDHEIEAGIEFADVRFFEDNLAEDGHAEDIKKVYEKAKARLGEVSGGQDTETKDEPYVKERHKSATLDEEKGIYTFGKPVEEGKLEYNVDTGMFGVQPTSEPQYYGIELKNPFVENKDALRQTVDEALEGQERVYPNSPKKEYSEAASEAALKGDGLLLANGNAGDTYNGVKYHRPVWTKGASISFWCKPADLSDRSPILYMCGDTDKGGAFGLLADGSVVFASLKYADWTQWQPIGANQCQNCFTALGDGEESEYVKEGEWNYYTVTFKNDWIQVYVNGQELVYKFVNLGGTKANKATWNLKFFNAGFMTAYNTIGQPTAADDPKGYFKACGGLAENGVDNFLCSIRAQYTSYKFSSNPDAELNKLADGYQAPEIASPTRTAEFDKTAGKNVSLQITDPEKLSWKGSLMMDLLTDDSMKLYFGGAPSQLSTDGNPSVAVQGASQGGNGWNAHGYGAELEDGDKNPESSHLPASGTKAPDFWFNSKHNQEGSSFADFRFEAEIWDDAKVAEEYGKLTADPEGNPITK